eukprot:CAMPEP_0168354402 /NCGR_PEP_ID=MMETSP0213-20121227/23879_1 /TAXON_ID=151035 /ORGANISM="Euplotes harpa, Strain FSP1.4" /LENGTH=52 /DNA_ID=CAMNT_0008366305 /DNA_START=512 /DNA_END=667 /DNA_ORIENTATION=-
MTLGSEFVKVSLDTEGSFGRNYDIADNAIRNASALTETDDCHRAVNAELALS